MMTYNEALDESLACSLDLDAVIACSQEETFKARKDLI